MKKIAIGIAVAVVLLLGISSDTVQFMFRECPQKSGYLSGALQRAAKRGSAQDVRFLVEKCYAHIDGGALSLSPLLYAAGWGNVETIRELIKLGAATNYGGGSDGYTPLMNAASAGHTEAIMELVGYGADRQKRDEKGKTAFDYWKEEQKDHPDYQEIADLLRPLRK